MTPELPNSVWAAVSAPGPQLTLLDGDIDVEAVVIGAGFTGLSTALHLVQDGVDVVVLEAAEPGWGASGRNNGQVIPTLTRPEPDDIIAKHGDAGEKFVAVLRDSAGYLFDVARQFGLNAEAEQSGWIQPVHTPGRMKIAERRVQQWSKHGAPVDLLSREQVRDLTGSEIWHGGWSNSTGGHINPLALARELARAVVNGGARIFQHTPALSFRYSGHGNDARWIVETPRGQVTARRLMLATNAYTGEFAKTLAPAIANEVVPIVSWQLATKPLGDNLRRHIIPGRQAVSDTHGDLHFTRYDARNRLITGGALMIPVNGVDRMKSRIGARLKRMFEPIGDIGFDYVWNGYVGMTTDFMPRFHQLGPNGFAWVGCNGRGVALSVALGREFSKALQDVPVAELGLPVSKPKPLLAHGIVRRLAPLRLIQFRWNDAKEI
ncbi:MAG: FAD-binding oxidoreductase [Hyphomicrobiaceae bacterium]